MPNRNMFTPSPNSFDSGEKVGRTFIWNEPDSPSDISTTSSHTPTYLFTKTNFRVHKANHRPSTPLPAAHVTPREITPRILPGQIQPGGRHPRTRRDSGRSDGSLFQPRRQFIFEDIDESAQEDDGPSLFSPGMVDENRNRLGLSLSSSTTTPELLTRQRTKTFILDDDSVQISEDGSDRRPPSVESIRLNDPRSPLLTSREAQRLCLGKSSKGKKGFIKNIGAVKGMLLCQCNCSSLRTKNRVGCLSDTYEEI